MVFRTWDLNFGAWEILGYGFQDMVFETWDLNFGAWEILGYGFQDMVFETWDLNFGAWIFTPGLQSGHWPRAPTSSPNNNSITYDYIMTSMTKLVYIYIWVKLFIQE